VVYIPVALFNLIIILHFKTSVVTFPSVGFLGFSIFTN